MLRYYFQSLFPMGRIHLTPPPHQCMRISLVMILWKFVWCKPLSVHNDRNCWWRTRHVRVGETRRRDKPRIVHVFEYVNIGLLNSTSIGSNQPSCARFTDSIYFLFFLVLVPSAIIVIIILVKNRFFFVDFSTLFFSFSLVRSVVHSRKSIFFNKWFFFSCASHYYYHY